MQGFIPAAAMAAVPVVLSVTVSLLHLCTDLYKEFPLLSWLGRNWLPVNAGCLLLSLCAFSLLIALPANDPDYRSREK